MEPIVDFEQAGKVAGSVHDALRDLRGTEFWRLSGTELLSLAGAVERIARLTFAVQVHLAGEIDTRGVAADQGCPSTAALLRSTLLICQRDAAARVKLAAAVLPRDLPSGGEAPPTLPLLGAALTGGTIGVDQARTTVTTLTGLPTAVDPETRALAQELLVDNAIITEPAPFAVFARRVGLTCDPDGELDETRPQDRVELSLGVRNPATGMTRLTGQLDDEGVEILGQAIDGLAGPHPTADGQADHRSAAARRGQALTEVLRRHLDTGQLPIQGAERPHVTITIDFQDLRDSVGAGILAHGGPIGPALARRYACDAAIIPAVLGSASQVLDIGTASRVWPTGIRRAITLRDKGCTWPGCDRPAGWCDAHHVRFWADGGPTSYDNGVLLCGHHHTQIHLGHWNITLAADGTPEYTPPPWIDPTRTPRRNHNHHLTQRLRR